MAIQRKRSQSSAVEDDSEESQKEDSSPSKKTATLYLNIKSSETLPLLRSGPVPAVTMIVRIGEREDVLRILLDTGSTVAILSIQVTKDKQIPVAERETTGTIQDYARQAVQGAGEYYTAPILLQHRHHYSRVYFEVARLASDYDAILPRYWLAKHKCDLLANNGRMKFTLAECQRRCTRKNQD